MKGNTSSTTPTKGLHMNVQLIKAHDALKAWHIGQPEGQESGVTLVKIPGTNLWCCTIYGLRPDGKEDGVTSDEREDPFEAVSDCLKHMNELGKKDTLRPAAGDAPSRHLRVVN